jgi:hypothetical protein
LPGQEHWLQKIDLYLHSAKHYLIALIPSFIPICFYALWKIGVKKAVLAPATLESINEQASRQAKAIFKQYWLLALLLPATSLLFTMADLNNDSAWRHSLHCDLLIQLSLPVQGILIAGWLRMVYKTWAASRNQHGGALYNIRPGADRLIVLGFSIAFSRLIFGYALNIGPLYTPIYLLLALYPTFLFSRDYGCGALGALADSVNCGRRKFLTLAVLIGRISCLFWFVQFILASLVAYFANLAQILPSRFPIDILPYSGFVLQSLGQLASLVYDTYVLLNCLEYLDSTGQNQTSAVECSAGLAEES